MAAHYIVPSALHTLHVADISGTLENPLRKSITAAIWDKKGRRKSNTLILTMFAKGHLNDPIQFVPVRRVINYLRAAKLDNDLGSILYDTQERILSPPTLGIRRTSGPANFPMSPS